MVRWASNSFRRSAMAAVVCVTTLGSVHIDAFAVSISTQRIGLPAGSLGKVAKPKTSVFMRSAYRQSPNSQLTESSALQATPAAASACAAVVAPNFKAIVLSCLLPSLLGYYKSEYGVSYAYGTATATVAYLVLRTLPSAAILPIPSTIAAFHATAVLFYGVRLNIFLLYRELLVPRFRKMRERIEDRAKSRGNRLSRTPFILFCAFLYGCMTAPLLVTQKLFPVAPLYSPGDSWAKTSMLAACCVTWFGFILGAVGDLTKSVVKASKGDDHLVTSGVYRFFRHPNYTGEVMGWTANCAAALFAVLSAGANWRKYAPYLVASVLGSTLISFVLGAATVNLESRQKEQYGNTQDYKKWVNSSWVGFKLGKARKDDGENDTAEKPEEMPDFDKIEGDGSGI